MAGIENLKNRIISDNEDRAKQIENEARQKAEELIKQTKLKADEMAQGMKLKAERDGKDRKERLIARAQLDARNEILVSKQTAIEKVLDRAAQKIESLEDKEYFSFIENMLLSNIETGEEEIVFSEKDSKRLPPSFLSIVNDKLNAMGKRGALSLSQDKRNIGSGFILKHGGVEINCSVEAQIRLLRDSLEGEIASLLFEGK